MAVSYTHLYYIIDEVTQVDGSYAAGSLCMVDTANPTAGISVKSDYPKVEKKIQEDDPSQQITDPDGWNDIADYEIGQTVPYKYTSNIPNMNGYDTYYYAWHDKMDPSLTFHPQTVQIHISGCLLYTSIRGNVAILVEQTLQMIHQGM